MNYTALEIGFDYLPYWDDDTETIDSETIDSETIDSETSNEQNNIIELPF